MITSDTELHEKSREWGIPLIGIYSKNKLPPRHHNGAYIINLQDDETSAGQVNPGTHWTALWVVDPVAVYFDPFGVAPPSEVQLFADDLDLYYNEVHIQNIRSGWCGYYVLFFLLCMKDKPRIPPLRKFEHFYSLWSPLSHQNLQRLKHYLKI
jgi:hypothetical protein